MSEFFVLCYLGSVITHGAFRDVLRRIPQQWVPQEWPLYVIVTYIPPAAFACFGRGVYSFVGYTVYFPIGGTICYYAILTLSIMIARRIIKWYRRL